MRVRTLSINEDLSWSDSLYTYRGTELPCPASVPVEPLSLAIRGTLAAGGPSIAQLPLSPLLPEKDIYEIITPQPGALRHGFYPT